MNLYDIGFDYPEAHVIKKDGKFYYAFYTHSWTQLGSPPERWYRFGTEFDFTQEGLSESDYPTENYSGKLEFRGLDENVKYRVVDYVNQNEMGTIDGDNPFLNLSFDDYLLLELNPL
jgi:alpha-galactosidase